MRPGADIVLVSCCFTWDATEAKRLVKAWGQYYEKVVLGGPVFKSEDRDFVPGLFVKQGVTFTSRGCRNQCPWCLVPKREGILREIKITEGNIIQDNNLLQCDKSHTDKVFAMLRTQRAIEFSGGLEARLLTGWMAEDIRSLRVKQVFLACDTEAGLKPLQRAIQLLGLPRDKVRCYVLLRFNENETISEATARLEDVWHSGAMPSPQLYQPADRWIKYSKEWRDLQRNWTRPAITKVLMRGINERLSEPWQQVGY